MAERRKWTQEDTQRQQNLIADAKKELLKIAAEFDSSCIGNAHDDKIKGADRYDHIHLLRQIEGLQQILVYHGVEQPMTSLPFFAQYAVEQVKKYGSIGAHRSI